MDVFGQLPVKKQQDCICPNCSRTLAADRFAPHLEKCMGMGRNSSRIASKRLRGQGPTEGEYNDDNDVDYDWMEYEKKSTLSTLLLLVRLSNTIQRKLFALLCYKAVNSVWFKAYEEILTVSLTDFNVKFTFDSVGRKRKDKDKVTFAILLCVVFS